LFHAYGGCLDPKTSGPGRKGPMSGVIWKSTKMASEPQWDYLD
jgi:hypothetical protein